MISVSGLCLCLRDAALYLTAILTVYMASRGRGRRGRPRGTSQAPPIFDQPPVFDQQAFSEAVGVAAADIAHASIAGIREVLVTSRGLERIILRHSQGEETRWW